jgi:hypothetical protein
MTFDRESAFCFDVICARVFKFTQGDAVGQTPHAPQDLTNSIRSQAN